jgi:hypothetical protein
LEQRSRRDIGFEFRHGADPIVRGRKTVVTTHAGVNPA